VTLDRVAAWLSFGAAVIGQAAVITGGFLLTDDASSNALRNAGTAGALAVACLAVMILARRAGTAPSRPVNLRRMPLRLVPQTNRSDVDQRRRPAA